MSVIGLSVIVIKSVEYFFKEFINTNYSPILQNVFNKKENLYGLRQ